MFKRLGKWALERLKERSTWRGLIAVATSAGLVSLDPALKEVVITSGLAAFGANEAVFSENKNKDKKENE